MDGPFQIASYRSPKLNLGAGFGGHTSHFIILIETGVAIFSRYFWGARAHPIFIVERNKLASAAAAERGCSPFLT